MEEKKFNVLIWDINARRLTTYDVLPYFREAYEEKKKADRPTTREEWIKFVESAGKYMFWSRCEWEIIVSEWPPAKEDQSVKIDVWHQINNNLDLIVDILMDEKKSRKSKGNG